MMKLVVIKQFNIVSGLEEEISREFIEVDEEDSYNEDYEECVCKCCVCKCCK